MPRYAWTPWCVLVCGLAATVAVTAVVHWTAREQNRLRFENAVQDAELTIRNRLGIYLALLRGGSGLFAARERVTREQFRAYVERLDIPANYPGIQGVGFSQRVRPEEKQSVIATARAHGLPGFNIWPETPREEYHTIVYLEPLDRRNRAAIGYDMFFEPTRRAAMITARDTGRPAASGKVTLVQEIDERKQAGFLIYVPVYRDGEVPASVEARRDLLVGFVYSPFRADDLFAGIFGRQEAARLALEVYDGAPSGESLLHRSGSHAPRAQTIRLPLEVAGRQWSLVFYATPQMERSPLAALAPFSAAAGLLVTAFLFLATLSQRRAQLAAERSTHELQESQESLRASEELHRTLSDAAPDAIITLDAQNHIVTANRATRRVFGYTPEELPGQPFAILVPPSARETFESELRQLRGTEQRLARHFELQGHRKDGSEVPLEISIGESHRHGRTLVTAILRDITERKEAEAQQLRRVQNAALRADITLALARPARSLRESLQECTDAIMRYLPAAFARIWILEPEENVLVLHASAGMYTHIDGPHSRIPVGHLKIGLIAHERRPHLTNDVAHDPRISDPAWARTEGMTAFAGYPLLLDERLVGVVALFSRCALHGDTIEALGTVADVIAQGVQRKRAESALRQAQEELRRHAEELEHRVAERTMSLEESVRSLESFSYSIAHDLRGPLRTIHSFADLLLDEHGGQMRGSARDYADRIVSAARRMDDLIQDLLAYGRLSRENLPAERVDLDSCVTAVVDQLGADIAAKSARVEVARPLPPVIGNRTMVEQVLANLVSNALKFVPPDRAPAIAVFARAHDGRVRLTVQDNGIGIDPAQHSRIFGVFERLHPVDNYPGTGIGLAIVHKAMERMNGSVGVESVPGQGSAFWIELPAG